MSLNARLIIVAGLVLAGFFGFTGFALDEAFRQSAESAVHDRLQAQLYGLLAVSELDDHRQLKLPASLPDARLSTPGSGLYAEITTLDDVVRWRSQSLLGRTLPRQLPPKAGEWSFERLSGPDGNEMHLLAFGITWAEAADPTGAYTFRVAESLEGYDAQLSSFRRSLWGWLLGAALVLLTVQGVVLRWGLKPLRWVAGDLREIEAGRQLELRGRYPRELRGLTENLNALLRSQRMHLQRYRDSLADLAHSLKTPLAVMRGATERSPEELRQTIHEQVQRMSEIVDYRLHRAAASGRSALAKPVAIRPLLERLVNSLLKVHADKVVACEIRVPANAALRGDEGDLMELFGNVLENAFKWSGGHIVIAVENTSGLTITVEDDGPGIPESQIEHVLKRGMRADQQVPGHGIGLSVVKDIIEAYEGTLTITRSDALGGASFRITFPTF
jgi:two-component system sensor histidine kinase PhoQ